MMIEKRNFLKGLNADLSPRLLSDGEMLNLMNARVGVTERGRSGRVENVMGTTLISQTVYPPYGTNLCLGSCVDNPRSRLIYFLWNSFGYHAIYATDISTSTPVTYAILYDSQVTGGLNFSKDYRIDKNARVVGDLLYWTDYNNEVRRINMEAAIKMNHPSYVTDVDPYTWPMNESVITLIRRPLGLPVSATKVTDGTVSNNFLVNFAGQFAVQYVYRDFEDTVMSAPSAMLNYNILNVDTYNAVDVVFDGNEDIDQDVLIVNLCVRYDNDPSYFVIRKWDKRNTLDNLAIANHNNGIQDLTYRFYNDFIGEPIGDAQSVKPADSIPLNVKTLDTADNRLFLSNYVKGYDTPVTTSLSGSITQSSVDVSRTFIWKFYSSYQLAIRFRDYYKRQSAVVTNDDLVIEIPDCDLNGLPYTSLINWTLSNADAATEIPDWAYYYDILITKNLRTRFFIKVPTFLQYAIKAVDGTFTYQNTYTSSAFGVALFNPTFRGQGYVFEDGSGDLARIYLSSTTTVYELPIIAQSGNYIIAQLENLGGSTTPPGMVFEIYTPYKKSLNEPFYTTGQSYAVTNPETESRTYSTLSGSLTGDTLREKYGPDYHVEFMSPNSNFWKNWMPVFGESNFQTLLGQVNKTNFIQWSNTKIQGSQINGLSTFESLNEKALPASMGEISKIQVASKVTEQGRIMLAIGEKETASLYLSEVQVVGASQNAFLAQSDNVIGTVNILQGSYGTTVPSSVLEYLGLVFWLDNINGVIVQYSPNGLEPVSRYNMTRFFKRYCKDYNVASTGNLDNINGFHHIPSCIDPFHKEVQFVLPGLIYENYATTLPSYSSVPSYATSIIDRFDIYDQLGKTMAFCFEENKWGSNFEYLPEQMEYLNDRMFSWKNGNLYEFNSDSTNWNNFFGTQYPIRICGTGNLNPSALKVLNNISVESNVVPDFSVALANYPNTQITDLADTDYTNQQGFFYSTWLMDRLSPNASGTADEKLYTGDSLTDIAIMWMLEFQAYNSLVYINFVNIGYSLARGQKQILNPVNS